MSNNYFVTEDKELYPILKQAKDEELEILAKIISEKISSEINENCRSPFDIASEIQLMGGNSVANLYRGHGVRYREIALDVVKRIKVKDVDEYEPIAQIEWKILQKLLDDLEKNMSDEDKRKLYEELKKRADDENDYEQFKDFFKLGASPYLYILILELILPYLLRMLGLEAAAVFVAGRAATAWIPVVGWILAGGGAILSLASTAYSITIPCVAIVGAIRARLEAEKVAKDIGGI
jgi:uncharacterized protein YaaW (UPF0174 family)